MRQREGAAEVLEEGAQVPEGSAQTQRLSGAHYRLVRQMVMEVIESPDATLQRTGLESAVGPRGHLEWVLPEHVDRFKLEGLHCLHEKYLAAKFKADEDMKDFFDQTFDDPDLVNRAVKKGYTSLVEIKNMGQQEMDKFYKIVKPNIKDRKKLDLALKRQRRMSIEAAPETSSMNQSTTAQVENDVVKSLMALKIKSKPIFKIGDAQAIAAALEEAGGDFEDLMDPDGFSDALLVKIIVKDIQREKFIKHRNKSS